MAAHSFRTCDLVRRSKGPRRSQPFGRPRLRPNRPTRRHVNSQTTFDPNIFAIGDCAACPQTGGAGDVPPRAQAAHGEASASCQATSSATEGRTAKSIHLSRFRLTCFARSVQYRRKSDGIPRWEEFLHRRLLRASDVSFALQRSHEAALHEVANVILSTIGRTFRRRNAPVVKLQLPSQTVREISAVVWGHPIIAVRGTPRHRIVSQLCTPCRFLAGQEMSIRCPRGSPSAHTLSIVRAVRTSDCSLYLFADQKARAKLVRKSPIHGQCDDAVWHFLMTLALQADYTINMFEFYSGRRRARVTDPPRA